MLEEPPHNTRLSSPANNCTACRTRTLHHFIFPTTLAWHHRVFHFIDPINNKKAESNSNPSESDQKPNESRPNFKSSSPAVKTLSMEKGKRICGYDVGHWNPKKFVGERCRFSIALKKEEIEEDFFGIMGVKPPRRPKKRPRNIQKKIDSVFPGSRLSEITPDLYKVNAKRP